MRDFLRQREIFLPCPRGSPAREPLFKPWVSHTLFWLGVWVHRGQVLGDTDGTSTNRTVRAVSASLLSQTALAFSRLPPKPTLADDAWVSLRIPGMDEWRYELGQLPISNLLSLLASMTAKLQTSCIPRFSSRSSDPDGQASDINGHEDWGVDRVAQGATCPSRQVPPAMQFDCCASCHHPRHGGRPRAWHLSPVDERPVSHPHPQ